MKNLKYFRKKLSVYLKNLKINGKNQQKNQGNSEG